MIRDPEHEQMPRTELEKLQLERLKAKVSEVYEKVPFYRHAFKEKGVTPDDIQTLADLTRQPHHLRSQIVNPFPCYSRNRKNRRNFKECPPGKIFDFSTHLMKPCTVHQV